MYFSWRNLRNVNKEQLNLIIKSTYTLKTKHDYHEAMGVAFDRDTSNVKPLHSCIIP